MMKRFQNKTGENIQKSLKKEILIFGKNMKRSFGKITMQGFVQMEEMGNLTKAKEPKKQPNLFVDVDKSLCIGCCSCEIIAPDVFQIRQRRNDESKIISN